MDSKINIKARIKRHSRVLLEQKKKGFSNQNYLRATFGYKIISFIVLVLIPIYPVFSLFINNVSEEKFNRGNIDEGSILSSYSGNGDAFWDGDVFIQSKESFLYINAPIDKERDVSGSSEIVEYKVKPWESVAFISQKFGVSKNTIYWANDFSKSHTIHPGDVIKVPPVSGIIHTVKSGDTISGIAEKYDVSEKKIMRQNLLLSGADLKAGSTIIVPWAEKELVKPVYTSAPTHIKRKIKKWWYAFSRAGKSEYVSTVWRYKLTQKPKYHTFYWGNCTWYVAKYKTVNWWGNANAWIKNAKAKWHATGKNPTLGSIIVFNGRWYNPRYGHVAIVMDIKKDYLIVSDMNYRRLWEITTRKIYKNDRAILWYIYVD